MNKKLTQEELTSLTSLSTQFNQLSTQLTLLMVEKEELQQQIHIIIDKITKLKQQDSVLTSKLIDKYGKGSISLENGEFVPQS